MNNILYKNVVINYKKIKSWKEEFIPRSIKNNIFLSSSNYSKYQSYIYNFNKNNFKNDIYTVISDF